MLVHGSVAGGQPAWSAQERSPPAGSSSCSPGRASRPARRSSGWTSRSTRLVERELRTGDHLVGHSYGGVSPSSRRPGRASRLALADRIEPPATTVAAGHPAVDRFAREGADWWRSGPRDDPESFLRGFLGYVGSAYDPPSPLPPEIEQGARTLIAERGPWEAEIPLDELAAATFPTLVVSGAHHEAFDAICDVLEERLAAERVVVPGAGHNPQRAEGFNDVLEDFLRRASSSAS